MDTTQLTQQVSWLDEQHRRDRNELVTLQQRVETQSTQIMELTRKLQEAEGRLASTTAQLTRFSQVDQALNQLKEEVIIMLKREEEQRQLAEREANRIRLIEREAGSKAINDLRQQMRIVPKMQDEMALRKAEEQRLSEAILSLRQDLIDLVRQSESWPKSLAYLEEQRRQENKRSAQLQQETAELLKRTEALRGHFDVSEKALSRLETRLNSLWNMRDEIKSEHVRAQESLLLADEERNRRSSAQAEQFAGFTQQMEEFRGDFNGFRDLFDDYKRLISQLSQLEERLKRDMSQVSELQRLAEERMRKEYEEFQAEEERRWRKHQVASDHQWSEQKRGNSQVQERLGPVEEQCKVLAVKIAELWEIQQAYARLRSSEVERWLVELSKFWDERTR